MSERDPEERQHSWSVTWRKETVTINDEQIALLPEWMADEIAEVTENIEAGYRGSSEHFRLKLLRAHADIILVLKEERERRAYAPWYNQ